MCGPLFTAAIAEKQKDRSRIKLEPSTTHHSITQNDGYYYLFNRWYYDLNSCTSWFTTAISKQRSTVHDTVRLAYLLWCWLGTYTVLRPSHFLTWIPGTISTSFVSPFFTRHLLVVHSRAASRPQPLKTVLAENGPTLPRYPHKVLRTAYKYTGPPSTLQVSTDSLFWP